MFELKIHTVKFILSSKNFWVPGKGLSMQTKFATFLPTEWQNCKLPTFKLLYFRNHLTLKSPKKAILLQAIFSHNIASPRRLTCSFFCHKLHSGADCKKLFSLKVFSASSTVILKTPWACKIK